MCANWGTAHIHMEHVLAVIFTHWRGFLRASIWILLLPHTGHLQCAKHGIGVRHPHQLCIMVLLLPLSWWGNRGSERSRSQAAPGWDTLLTVEFLREALPLTHASHHCCPAQLCRQPRGPRPPAPAGRDPSATSTHSRGEWQTPTGQTRSPRHLCGLPYILARDWLMFSFFLETPIFPQQIKPIVPGDTRTPLPPPPRAGVNQDLLSDVPAGDSHLCQEDPLSPKYLLTAHRGA